ncbi:uncharacterized protein LOC111623487 isoform X1 [Centruroides sculpturatus]|uniref:uncharacterized protein LOC111623487 isoform X1 n=1 Tax=Centruroides sculpturatus TaxID=218467 RepID=UPI000C6E943F|nr:uncharacterized protein LOC111623487 isoform X1 [Centruroides sculpturatus]
MLAFTKCLILYLGFIKEFDIYLLLRALLVIGGIESNPGPMSRTPPSSPISKSSISVVGKRQRSPSEPTLKSQRLENFFPPLGSSNVPQNLFSFLEEKFDTILTKLEDLSTKFEWLANLHKDFEQRLLNVEKKVEEISNLNTSFTASTSYFLYLLDSSINECQRNNIVIAGLEGNSSEILSLASDILSSIKRPSGDSILIKDLKIISKNKLVVAKLDIVSDKKLIYRNVHNIQKREGCSRVKFFDDLYWRSRLRRKSLFSFYQEAKKTGKDAYMRADCLTVNGENFTFDLISNKLMKIEPFLLPGKTDRRMDEN